MSADERALTERVENQIAHLEIAGWSGSLTVSLLHEQQAEIDSLRRDLEAARVVIDAARAVAQHGTCATREEIAELVVRVGSFDLARARGEG